MAAPTNPLSVDDNGGSLTVDGSVSVSNFPAVQPVSDNAGSLTVDAVDLDIRNLTAATDVIRVGYDVDPAWLGVFSVGIQAAGVAAANNYFSLFNPAASGRNLVLLSVELEEFSVAVAAPTAMFVLKRATAASGGTLLADSSVARFRTSDGDPVAEVRTGNPTTTEGASITQFARNQNVTAAGTTAVSRRMFRPDPTWGEFRLAADEGVVLDCSGGDTDQQIAVTFVWAER